MVRKHRRTRCDTSIPGCGGGCRVESLVSVDERGQMVLPKELRERAGIKPNEKLAIISWEQEGKIHCLSLVRAEALTGMAHGLLGPMMKDLAEGSPRGEKG